MAFTSYAKPIQRLFQSMDRTFCSLDYLSQLTNSAIDLTCCAGVKIPAGPAANGNSFLSQAVDQFPKF